MATASKFDVEASIKNSTNEAGLNGRRSHSSYHNGGLAEKAGERCIEVNGAIAIGSLERVEYERERDSPRLHKARGPFLTPPLLILNLSRTI